MEGIECHARSSAGTGNSGMKEASECVINIEQGVCYRDSTLCNCWLNGVCLTVVSASVAEPEVSKAGSWDRS